ncbi:MAG: hypothetical protein AAFZ18_28615 [Myxococcota bacterium]
MTRSGKNRRILSETTTGRFFFACLILTGGCAPTGRYLGRLGDGPAYVNRGYGVVAPVGGLGARWWAFDPEHPERGPRAVAPVRRNDRIDLDGDGMLRLDEITPRYEPSFRMLSKTSSAARIELEVHILSEPEASKVTLRGLLDSELRSRAARPETARDAIDGVQSWALPLGRTALVGFLPALRSGPGALALALVEQPGFEAEDGLVRRQVVRVMLWAPQLADPWLADHRAFVTSMLASPSAGASTRSERW